MTLFFRWRFYVTVALCAVSVSINPIGKMPFQPVDVLPRGFMQGEIMQRIYATVGLLLLCIWFLPAQAAEKKANAQPRPALMVPLSDQVAVLDVRNLGDYLLAVGARGHVLRSDDGKHWKQIPSPLRSMLTRVRFFGGGNGWAVGWDHSIMHSSDGGMTWTLQRYNEGDRGRPYYDVYFSDAQHGIVVGSYGNYLETQDGGATWTPKENALTYIGNHLSTITKLNDGSLLISGERGLLAHSTDQGHNWKVLNSPYIGSFFGALPYGEHGAIVYGLRGNAFLLADVSACAVADQNMIENWFMREDVSEPAAMAALGWQHFANSSQESLFDAVWMQADSKALFVGDSGEVEVLDVASMSMHPITSPSEDILASVVGFKGQYIATGRRGFVQLKVGE